MPKFDYCSRYHQGKCWKKQADDNKKKKKKKKGQGKDVAMLLEQFLALNESKKKSSRYNSNLELEGEQCYIIGRACSD